MNFLIKHLKFSLVIDSIIFSNKIISMLLKKLISLLLLFTAIIGYSQLKPFSIISDNMVLQRNIPVPLWGTAQGSNEVEILFASKTKKVTVIDGKWLIKLDAMKESSIPQDLTIKTDKEALVFHNIVIGDVWIAGGQSNMERQLGPRPPQKPLDNWESEAANADYPLIREFSLPHNGNRLIPVESINAQWAICNPKNVVKFSAVGYYFAKTLNQQINVPIGIIHSSWGGTPIEKWISKEALDNNPDFQKVVETYNQSIANYPNALTFFKEHKDSIIKKWQEDSALSAISKKPLAKKPSPPQNPQTNGDCGGLFKTMIEPFLKYPIKGAIWYQGEANVGNTPLYRKLMPAMIADWRSKWGIGDFPFLCVQLAPYRSNTPELREAQLMSVQKVKNTALIVTLDSGDTTDIHPTHKKVVGERLALAARAIAYNEKLIEYSGPIFKSFTIKDDKVKIDFTHIGKGLTCNGSDLVGFTISEDGKSFVKAQAFINNNQVVVSADGISNPVAVRYAFINNANGNLFNQEGLPASPFRTDIPKE